MTGAVERLMLATLEIFGERDEAARVQAISETYTEDVTFSDEEGVITGRAALNEKVGSLLAGSPGFVFSVAGPIHVVQDLGVLTWTLGLPGGEVVVSGTDIATVREGKINTLHTYLVKPAGD